MELLYAADGRATGPLTDEGLAAAYAFPPGRWLRANFVSSLDGAGTGADHRSGSINTPADNTVFALQRRLCDAVVVGAGTARAEGYRPVPATDGHAPALVVVSNHGDLPDQLLQQPDGGRTIAVVPAGLESAISSALVDALGVANVWELPGDRVDISDAIERLATEGMPHVLCEGGPHLFTTMLAAGVVDEVALTITPTLVGGGDFTRITAGAGGAAQLSLHHLIDSDDTLLGLWRVHR